MPDKIFPLIIELEHDIEEVFDHAFKNSMTKENKQLFQEMKQQSVNQVNNIDRLASRYNLPKFKTETIFNMQKHIHNSLWDDVSKKNTIENIIEAIVEAKTDTAKLYHALAAYYKNLSLYYEKISREIEYLSQEEEVDKDQLMDKYKK